MMNNSMSVKEAKNAPDTDARFCCSAFFQKYLEK